jgi:hypothetical protein
VLPTRNRWTGQIARKLKMTAKSFKLLSYLSIAAAFALAAPPVQAGSHGNGAAGGGFPQYRNLADAQKACAGDTVVWGSSEHRGVFYVDGVGPQRIGGFYACMAVAQKAGMQIVTSN